MEEKMMRKMMRTVLFGGIMGVCGILFAGEASVDMNSAYVWRGITFNDGTVIQPSVDLGLPYGFGVNVWGNFDVDDYDGAMKNAEFSEIDITVSVSRSIGEVECGAGFIEYLFPHQGGTNGASAGTREIYGSVGFDVPGDVSLALTLYYDIDEIEDFYANLALSRDINMNDALSMEFSLSVGCAGKNAAAGTESGMHEYSFSVVAQYSASDHFGLGANISFVDGFDSDVLPDQDVDVYGGISVSIAL